MKKDPQSFSKLQRDVLKLIQTAQEQRRKDKMSYKIIEAAKSVDYADLGKRALWTFVQAFLAVILYGIEAILDPLFAGDFTGAWALLLATGIAGLAAGLSALKTFIVGIVNHLKELSRG